MGAGQLHGGLVRGVRAGDRARGRELDLDRLAGRKLRERAAQRGRELDLELGECTGLDRVGPALELDLLAVDLRESGDLHAGRAARSDDDGDLLPRGRGERVDDRTLRLD